MPAFLAPVSYLDAGNNVQVGDFNNDGVADTATNGPGLAVSVRLGNGDGPFAAANASSVPILPLALVAADFNRDGKLDLVVSHRPSLLSGQTRHPHIPNSVCFWVMATAPS